MKKIIPAILLSFCCIASYAQGGMYGFEGGLGYGTAYKSHITPAVEGYYLKKLSPRWYAGGSIFLQRYSFVNTLIKDTANLAYGDVLSIGQKSTYLFFCPRINFGFGYHKYILASLSFGPGLYMGGNQSTYQYQPFWTNTSGNAYGADTASVNTTYNIPKVIFRVGLGISERLPTYGYWNIILSQEFTFLPGYISKGADSPSMSTGYISFTVGVMHKYPQVFVEY